MRVWVPAALVLALCGCGAASGGSVGTAPAPAELSGHVYSAPSCPVERAGQPCPPKPVGGARLDLRPSRGGQALVATTDAAGAYSISVGPGRYTVQVEIRRPLTSGPRSVDLGPGQRLTADFIVDSGIR